VTPLLLAAAGVLGLLVGWLLTSTMARVPAGQGYLRTPFACESCEAPIAPRDAAPLVSYLLLRGRCRACSAPIGAWTPAVEVGTAATFVATAAWLGWSPLLPAFLFFAALMIVLTAIDLQHKRLPDRLVLPAYPVLAALLAVAAATGDTWGSFGRALLGGLVLFAVYLVLALINPAGLGGGDVKLAGVLGMALGWFGWGPVAVGGFAGFFLGALIGGSTMLVGRAGRKTEIPFGPFMIAGTYLGLAVGGPIADWYLQR
jgi:leader peptidase (prepilin peptidase)/N-methyltransferase